ncbi:MAG: transporter, partial [Candidatus Eremiobacteraeota bacterium]|nr:transporter [Candidatus Eremiobacteraeota bacterium]
MTGVLILVAMAVFVALMMTRRLATPLALLALALVIGVLLGVPWLGKPEDSILGGIVSSGAVTLASTIVTVIF